MNSWKRTMCYVLFGVGLIMLVVQFLLYFVIEKEVSVTVERLYHEEDSSEPHGTNLERMQQEMDSHTNESLTDVETMERGIYLNFEVDRIVTGLKNRTEYAIRNGLPILLWWTPFTGEKAVVKRCKEGECFMTDRRKFQYHPQTKLFFFYGTDFKDVDLPLPRKAHHEWALLHEESPKNSFLYSFEDMVSLFNHTATFRQESDYPISTQYLTSVERLLAPPKLTFEEKNKLGLAPVVYLQSGCNPPSDRDAYINELMKYIEVDSYGQCLNNKEIPEALKSPLVMHDNIQSEFLAQYKFVLSFENAICNDYITEKLWNPLYGGAVPIYKGAPNVLEWMPNNHSIILADNFESPKTLAEYIKLVANNATLYEKYLSYKTKGIENQKLISRMKTREWQVNDYEAMSFITGFECFVCDRIHANRKRSLQKKTQTEYVAKLNHYGCPPPNLYPYETPPAYNEWERTSWQYEFTEAKGKASRIREKVFA